MTTEDAFQAALDAEPDNHTLREIFADWLDDQGDVRAEGYRALGQLRKVPAFNLDQCLETAYWHNLNFLNESKLPQDWFDLLMIEGKSRLFAPDYLRRGDNPFFRREAEDAAALAFAKLPAARRAELLKREPCSA